MNKYKITYHDRSEDIIEKADLSLNYPHSVVFRKYNEQTRSWDNNVLIVPYNSIKKIEKLD